MAHEHGGGETHPGGLPQPPPGGAFVRTGDPDEPDPGLPLESLLAHLPLVVGRLDTELTLREVYGAVHDLLGSNAEHFLGKSARELCGDRRQGAQFDAVCQQVLASRRPGRYDFGIGSEGEARALQAHLIPELDAAGEVRSLIGMVSERADQRRIEEDLRASEERYHTLLAQAKNYAIFAIDLAGTALSWNEGVERVLGWTREEFLRLSIERLFPPEDIAAGTHKLELARAAAEGSATQDHWLRRRDGSPFFASGTISRTVDAAGHVVGFGVVLRDRTAWKIAQDERDRLFESERKARQEAEGANRLKDEFLATLSHELRSPLNAIVGWVHVLRRHAETSPEIARGLAVIERNARSQTQIINDLLDMSRVMTGKVHLNVRSISVQRLVATTLDAIRPAAEAKGIELSAMLDSSHDRIRGDPSRLQQVLWNLLTNAVKFTPTAGRVVVSSRFVSGQLELSVQDSGIGIPGAFLPFVFDRFRQADASTTRPYGGLGLGLSLVKNLVELHGGAVRATSAGEGQGATFTVSLPPAQADARPESAPGEPLASSEETLESLPKLTGIATLVVDDEVDSLMFCGRLLEDRGARVLLAVDAQQALEMLRSERVDILVSDIGMPHEDGYHLIAELRALADARTAHIPAIAVTAYARTEDRHRLLLAGYQMHISKPIEPQELIAGIASLMGVAGRA